MKPLGILVVCVTAALLQVHLLQMACGNLSNDFNANIAAAWSGTGSSMRCAVICHFAPC